MTTEAEMAEVLAGALVKIETLRVERDTAARTALSALRETVKAIPNTSGGHVDSGWNDVIGATMAWHECHGLSRAAVLAAIDAAMPGERR